MPFNVRYELKVKDLLGYTGPVVIDGIEYDGIIDVTIVQDGETGAPWITDLKIGPLRPVDPVDDIRHDPKELEGIVEHLALEHARRLPSTGWTNYLDDVPDHYSHAPGPDRE